MGTTKLLLLDSLLQERVLALVHPSQQAEVATENE